MDFIIIEALFTEKVDRSVSELSKVYNNKALLKEKIQTIGEGLLNNGSIFKVKKYF